MVKVITQDGKFKVEGTFDFRSFAKKQQPQFLAAAVAVRITSLIYCHTTVSRRA